MAQVSLLVSTLLMGVLLLLTAVAVVASRNWYDYSTTEGPDVGQRLEQLAGSETVWILGFLVLVAVALAGSVFFVGGSGFPVSLSSAGLLLGVVLGAIVLLYFFWGVYSSSRYRGLTRATAVAVTVFVVGLLAVAVVSLKLLGMFPGGA